jgi:hypothetical protein
MSSKYIIGFFYDGHISLSIHNSYHEVEDKLFGVGYDKDQVNEILVGDTWYDENNYDYVKVQRVDV